MSIIIFRIDDELRIYLFTGDAGIESFRSIPKCREELGNLYWLKVPHHASQNNISRELVELMKPAHAYSSGNRHQDDHVLDCIRKISGGKVFSTKTYGGDLHFP